MSYLSAQEVVQASGEAMRWSFGHPTPSVLPLSSCFGFQVREFRF